MKKKHQQRLEYLVQVEIIEVRDLKGKDKSGTCDPFMRINVGNLTPQVTTTRSAANTAVFNQSFTFTGLLMNTVEFESFEIKIECFDLKQFGQNQLVGIFSVGISTLYRNPQHQIYNTWLPLVHPKCGLEPQGFLLASAYVISPTDRPPVHDMNENNVEEEPDAFGGVPDDQLEPEQLQQRIAKKNQIAIVSRPEVRGKSYQLMVNVVKAEDLPTMGYPTVDSFISVRAGGATQITSVMKNQQKPQYLSRLMYPLHFPFLNDKIVMRVWDKRSMMSDTFISIIPEIPQENDYFNINFLQSKGGVMPFRWYNLYGIPHDERPTNFQQTFFGYKKSIVGTDYMGRVLMSLNLTQSEKPELMVVPLTTQREPQIDRYLLRIDTYEIQEAKDCGEVVRVHFRIGGFVYKTEEAVIKKEKVNPYKNKKEEKKQEMGISYVWKDKKIGICQERIEQPQERQQIPDMIVSLYNEAKKRVAYIRIPYASPDLQVNRPKWYTFKSVKQTNNSDVPHSFFLVNILFRPEGDVYPLPRIIVKREIQQQYLLQAFFYAGYDLCPDCYSEETMAFFRLKIGGTYFELDALQPGKNPIWNKEFKLKVKIDQNLEFASNIILNFTNEHPSKKNQWFGNNHIGDICVSALSCKYEGEPRFEFHHIIQEGQSAGRILAAFHLTPLPKNDKTEYSKTPVPIFTEFHRMFVQFPVFGVRNLKQKLKDPRMIVKVPIPFDKSENDQYYNLQSIDIIDPQKIQLANNTSWFGGGITDPVFLKVVTLEVHLPPRIHFYPQLEIELFDANNKNERYICSIPLCGLDPVAEASTLQFATEFFEAGKIFEDSNDRGGPDEHLEEAINNDGDAKTSAKPAEQPQQATIFDKKQEEEPQPQQDGTKPTVKASQKQSEKQSEKFSSEITRLQTNITEPRDDEIVRQTLQTKGIFNVEISKMQDLLMTDADLQIKKKENKEKSKKLFAMLGAQKKVYLQFEQLKAYIRREVQKYKTVEVEEKQYFKQANEPDEGEGYDYGREVLKGPYEDEIAKRIPFKRFPLYRLSNSKYGVIGNPTNAIIKGDIKLTERSMKTVKGSSKKSNMSKKSSVKQQQQQQQEDYSFNLFDQDFLNFFNEPYKLKVRLYILRCLNLAAQNQNLDTYHKMAGMQAICSADSYPEVFIGDTAYDNQDLIKHVTDQDKPIVDTLSPNFFRMYELDAELPTDWKLILHLKNKGMFDSIIGSTQIDIEDRVVGEEKLKQRIAYTVFRERFQQELEVLKYDDSVKAENRKNYLKGQITNLGQRIENFDKKFQVPVEYKDLKIAERNQASQGTVEMFLEVLPVDVAREIEPSPLNPPVPQTYEVRLIIWETFELPKVPPKKVVDIMLAVSMDATATGDGKELAKETDVHNGSENGDGSFSFRMKFPLQIPCPFPRMKMTVYDFSPFGTNESLGVATISLKPILHRLRRDGKFEMPPTRIKLSHPNFPGQSRGEVLIQMDILTQQAADASPVGDAQDEPNVNPYLVKPTEGRGLADFFKGAGFGMGNFMLYVKIFAGLFILVVGVMILFVKPGILVN